MRPELSLDDETLSRLRTLEAFDLAPVRNRLLRTEQLDPQLIDLLIFEFRRYLALRLMKGHPEPMLSRAVDEIWHAALLYTRIYGELCNQVFGVFVHHDP